MPILSNIELRAMERGREEGILETSRSAVLEVLTVRFVREASRNENRVSAELSDSIEQITDVATLKQLLQQAISIESLTEFDRLLEDN